MQGFFSFSAASTARLALMVLAVMPAMATAANGYFLNGAGASGRALSGAGAAYANDSLSTAVNPAVLVDLDEGSWQMGATFLTGSVDVSISEFDASNLSPGAAPIPPGNYEHDPDTPNQIGGVFLIPTGAISWQLDDQSAFGVGVYGNGGLNNTYRSFPNANCPADTRQSGLFCDGTVGSDIAQTFIAPTYSRQVLPWLNVGASLLFVWQTFEVRGLQTFDALSSDPDKVSGNGHDNSFGVGYKLGAQIHPGEQWSFGGYYQPKVHMSEFDDYAGLLAHGGNFDVPPQFQLGLAYHPSTRVTLLVDYLKIKYEDVDTLGNLQTAPGRLGDNNGPGFGWRDVSGWKFAAIYRPAGPWTFRAGYSQHTTPLREDHLLFNLLAASTLEEHVSAGLSYRFASGYVLDVAATLAPKKTLRGPNFTVPDQQISAGDRLYSFDIALRHSF